MLTLKVEGMTCNHCISKVTKAIKELKSSATVEIDLTAHSVKVGSELGCQLENELDVEDIIMALEWAGYPAIEVVSCCTPDANCH